jgi:XRE family transcriptional regulator, fatty acid utilization regulator
VVHPEDDAISAVRREIERWRNHFSDLDSAAEQLADTLRLESADLYGAITERLRVKHQLSIRILPVETMPNRLRRLDRQAGRLARRSSSPNLNSRARSMPL